MNQSSLTHRDVLRYALRANAVFSAVSSLGLFFFARPLATMIALGEAGFESLAVQLAVFSLLLFLLSTQWAMRKSWTLGLVAVVVLLDLGWVLGSIVFVRLPSFTTETGRLLVLTSAGIVGLFFLLQAYALTRIIWIRLKRRRASRKAGSTCSAMLMVVIMLPAAAGCMMADIRTPELKESGYTEDAADKGRNLLHEVARRHGLQAWRSHETLQVVAVDRWAEGASGWWPRQEQRMKLESVLGTFTSRAELLDGERTGEIWGIHAWQPYTRTTESSKLVLEKAEKKMTARTFYLPALQYFNELPFRLLTADYVAYAGDRTHRGREYHLIFATWGSVEPNERHDQYLLWVDQQSLLVRMCLYTLRDAGTIFTGAIHFDDYRNVQGVLIPFEQTVVLPRPENALYPLDRYFFHRLEFESARFDEVDKRELLVASAAPAGDFK